MISPARSVAFTVLRRTFEGDAYTDRALAAEAARENLNRRDRGLAMQLAYGTVQRRDLLDQLIVELSDRPVERLEPPVLAALRLGLFQIAFLDGVAEHAAVHESVELAKAGRGRGHGLVNAVLRRATRDLPARLAQLSHAEDPDGAALWHSHPAWVARLWFDLLGADEARALMAANNAPAESAVRANTLVTDVAALAAALPVPTRPAEGLPEGLVLEGAFDAHGSEPFATGALTPQSRASMLVARVVGPHPGERVLDLCAAPGAKTTHLAALMEGRGTLVAVERDRARARRLRENAQRMRAGNVEVRAADARDDHGSGFDRVLVDPPCTGLGTLRSRPDQRWRVEPSDPARLARLQGKVLAAAARAVRPGGTLVYSTCTISPAENEAVVEAFLRAHADFAPADLHAEFPLWKHPSVPRHLQLLPHRDGTDGFFIARLSRGDG